MDFLSLPIDMIENIFSYLSYDEIAKNRMISKSTNEICKKMLNRGFLLIEKRHAIALKNVKAQLPRRESERRYHQLSRHCDILTSIETRISMLNMTYSKFIDNGLCCFIPGKVIDEIRRVLTIVETETTPPRAHEVLQELRDISSMAIEHFDDKVAPDLRRRLHDAAHPAPRPPQEVLGPLALKQEMASLHRRSLLNTKLSLYMATQFQICFKRMIVYKKMALRQNGLVKAMSRRVRDHEATIAEMKKRIEECDIKYNELTHTNQAVGGKAIAASKSSEVTSSNAQPLRHFSSQIKLDLSDLPIGTSRRSSDKMLPNIKPRKPVIKLPRITDPEDEIPAKVPKLDESRSPSTSKTRMPQAMAIIRSITNEIISLSAEGKLKRPSSADGLIESKKAKRD